MVHRQILFVFLCLKKSNVCVCGGKCVAVGGGVVAVVGWMSMCV